MSGARGHLTETGFKLPRCDAPGITRSDPMYLHAPSRLYALFRTNSVLSILYFVAGTVALALSHFTRKPRRIQGLMRFHKFSV